MLSFDKVFLNSAEVGRHMSVGDVTLHYHEQGQGVPVVLLPGLGFSMFTFRYLIPTLSQRYRVISMDLPGCGYSQGLPGGATVEDMADAVGGFIDGLCQEPVTFLGVAEGGLYALSLAQRRPERVAALALVSPGSLTRHYPMGLQMLLAPWLGEWLMGRIGDQDFIRVYQFFLFDKTLLSDHEKHQFLQPFDDPQARSNLLTLLRCGNTHQTFERLPDVSCPTLLFWGQYDTGHPLGMHEHFIRQIPGCTLRMMPNCGHLVQEERPGEMLESLEGFLMRQAFPHERPDPAY